MEVALRWAKDRFLDSRTLAIVIAQWLLVGVGFWALTLLWPDTLRVLAAGKGFDGGASWLTLGILLLFYRDSKAWVLYRHSGGLERFRRFLIFILITLNIAANMVALWFIWGVPLLEGNLRIPWQDWANIAVCGVVVVGVGMWTVKTGRKLFDPVAMFVYVVSTRIVPQGMLAVLPLLLVHIPSIPRATVWGLFIIALQQLAMTGLENIGARSRVKRDPFGIASRKAHDASRWLFRSDIWNVAAATFVLAVCLWRWA